MTLGLLVKITMSFITRPGDVSVSPAGTGTAGTVPESTYWECLQQPAHTHVNY